MCAGAFHLYRAAIMGGVDPLRCHWTQEPYLGSALPAIQVSGSNVMVYDARLKQGSDSSFENASA